MFNICCLCPTYGRPSLVRNVIAMFQAQHYDLKHARLLILDDGDQITGEGEFWKVVSVKDRYPSYCYKYGVMAKLCLEEKIFGRWTPDAFALFEDDDIYGPYYLIGHDVALKTSPWSHPSQVYSLYSVDTRQGQLPITEPSGGRFWSSAAIRAGYLERCGGFITSGRADADQLNLQNWSRTHQPARPDNDESVGIQWVYGWGRAQHCSGLMTDGPADTGWYIKHRKTEHHRIDNIQPLMDDQCKWLYNQLWCKGCIATDCVVRTP